MAAFDHDPEAGEHRLRFHLFVAGSSPRSDRAVQNLRRMVDEHLDVTCEVEIIDVLEFPERAEEDRILATPTLIRESPPPRRRITGDLSDVARVLQLVGTRTARRRP